MRTVAKHIGQGPAALQSPRSERAAVSTSPLLVNGKFTAQSLTGVQRVATELVLALDRQLVRQPQLVAGGVELVCPPGGRPPSLQRIGVRVAGAPGMHLHAWEQFELPRAARGARLLNLAGSAPWAGAARSLCVLHDAAVFDHPHAYTPRFRWWYRLLFRHLGRRAGTLATVSAFSRERLAHTLRVGPSRLTVVGNGADHLARVEPDRGVLARYGLVPRRYLLLVGTDKATKNFDTALAAWHLMPRNGEVLVWVGGVNRAVFSFGDNRAGLGREAVAHGVYRIGVVGDAQLKALYEAAAGLVVPSVYEGFGLPAAEAMACGCAVAAADAGALPEVCGGAALMFDPMDVAGLSAVMRRLLDDAALRRQLRERGVAVASRYTWDGAALRLLATLGACTSLDAAAA